MYTAHVLCSTIAFARGLVPSYLQGPLRHFVDATLLRSPIAGCKRPTAILPELARRVSPIVSVVRPG